MSTQLAAKDNVATLAPHADMAQRYGISEQKLELIRNACVGPQAPDDVLELYLHQCGRIGCDPMDKMLYAIPRNQRVNVNGTWQTKTVWGFQTSIDLFRSIAETTDGYEGQTEPLWCGEDGKWTDVWLSRTKPPAAAKIGVYRRGFREPVYAVALFSEYAQTDRDGKLQGLWAKMPAVMIAKCAEALALRKAFPKRLAGLYTSDEMGQAKNGTSEALETDDAAPALAGAPEEKPKRGKAPAARADLPDEVALYNRFMELTGAVDGRVYLNWLADEGIVDLSKREKVDGRWILTVEERDQIDRRLADMAQAKTHADTLAQDAQDATFTEESAQPEQPPLLSPEAHAENVDQTTRENLPCATCEQDEEHTLSCVHAPWNNVDQSTFSRGDSSKAQHAKIAILAESVGLSEKQRHSFIAKHFGGRQSATLLSKLDAKKLIDMLEEMR